MEAFNLKGPIFAGYELKGWFWLEQSEFLPNPPNPRACHVNTITSILAHFQETIVLYMNMMGLIAIYKITQINIQYTFASKCSQCPWDIDIKRLHKLMKKRNKQTNNRRHSVKTK